MDKLPDTIEECHHVIRLLLKAIDDLSKRVEALEIENRDLKERINNNSSNSSLPPQEVRRKRKTGVSLAARKRVGNQDIKVITVSYCQQIKLILFKDVCYQKIADVVAK